MEKLEFLTKEEKEKMSIEDLEVYANMLKLIKHELSKIKNINM